MEPRRVLALDLSLNRTGVALPDGELRSITTREDGYRRIPDIARQALELVVIYKPTLVAVEGYAYNVRHRLAAIRGAELGGFVRVQLELRRVPWVDVPPAELKRFATGKGTASKDEMLAAAHAAGADAANHDEADAWHLRAYALKLAEELLP